MEIWACAFVNLFDNNAVIKQVSVEKGSTWRDAMEKAFPGYVDHVSEDIDKAKEDAFDQEWLFDAIKIEI